LIKALLRRVLPRRFISAVRLLLIFQGGHGHVNRLNGFPVNGKGEFQPWLTYPLIEFLNGLDFSEKRVFEFGAGASTLYWAKRACEVVSVEFDAGWYEALLPIIPKNVTLHHVGNGQSYVNKVLECDGRFDVIVVDGAERYRSAQSAIKALADGGFIVLDNAEWYPNTADLLVQAGLIEVRLSGFTPVNAFTSTSSIFMSRNFCIPTNALARKKPIGGTDIIGGTLDDGPLSQCVLS
jgi:hypothetical protein